MSLATCASVEASLRSMLDKELGIESMAVVGDANFAIELSFLDAIHKKINKRKKK